MNPAGDALAREWDSNPAKVIQRERPTAGTVGGGGSRAGDRTRTGDVQLGKLAFYQLNYARDDR
jgi:hypothetical protein